MRDAAVMPMRTILSRALLAAVISFGLTSAPLMAADDAPTIDLNNLRQGPSAFPKFWLPYKQVPLAPVNPANGPLLERHLVDGKLALSLNDFLQLVIEDDLDISSARYNNAIAQVDLLRSASGQAARGVNGAALPAGLFSGAIGAGVNNIASLSSGGTGGAAIATQGRLIVGSPRGIFDPTFSMNLSYDHLTNPLNTKVVAGAQSVDVKSVVLQTRYQQELPIGTSYSLSVNLQRQTSTQAGLLFDPALTSYVSLGIYQPLLNGFGRALTRRFITVANNNRQIVTEAFHTTLNNTLSAAANAYWDLVALQENVRVAQEAVAAAEQQARENQERVDIGTMTPLDVLSSKAQLASARVTAVSAETKRRQQEELLKTYISRTGEPALEAASVTLTDPLPGLSEVTVPPVAESLAEALSSRASIRQAELSLRNEHIAQEYTKKTLLPILSVYAYINAYGLAQGTNPAVQELYHWAYPEYTVGFTWSLPLFNRAAQADDLRARLETQQAEATLQRTKQQITVQVKSATIALTQDRAGIDAAQRAVAASQVAYEGEQERLRAGISTPYRVTLAQRDLMSAESAEIQARVNYAKAVIAHELATGSLLQAHGVDAAKAQLGERFVESKPGSGSSK